MLEKNRHCERSEAIQLAFCCKSGLPRRLRLLAKTKSGFTLIELSIVLVVIGLVIGGVLVGQTLIKSAEERAFISQMEQYNLAVNAFKLKYNAIPGDITPSVATAFGLIACLGSSAGSNAYGDNDGIIEGPTYEGSFFWAQLADAGLISGNYKTASDGYLDTALCTITTTGNNWPQEILPKSKLNKKAIIQVNGEYSGLASFRLPIYYYTYENMATPSQLYNIDKKIDDGKPLFGRVQANDGIGPDEAQDCLANFTYDGSMNTYWVNNTLAEAVTYDLSPSTINNPSCGAFITFGQPFPRAVTEAINYEAG